MKKNLRGNEKGGDSVTRSRRVPVPLSRSPVSPSRDRARHAWTTPTSYVIIVLFFFATNILIPGTVVFILLAYPILSFVSGLHNFGLTMGRYEESEEWEDIIPIEQDDGGPNPLAAIAYTEDYSEAMSYLRAVMAKNEMSERALDLTEDIIAMNPAHYTVW